MGGKLHRRAPEHIRPVSSAEARQIPDEESESVSRPQSRSLPDPAIPEPMQSINQEIPNNQNLNPPINNPPSEDNSSQSQEQPDVEPEEGSTGANTWRFEMRVPDHVVNNAALNESADSILLATSEKKQRTEVKMSMLSPEEKEAFNTAKQSEVNSWLSAGTVSKVLREKLAPEQILRCQWLLVWKDREESPKSDKSEESKISKPIDRKQDLWF